MNKEWSRTRSSYVSANGNMSTAFLYTQAMWYSNKKLMHLSTGMHSSSVHGMPDVEPQNQ
jgi:hypothetical protein